MYNNPLFGVDLAPHCEKCKLHEGCHTPFMPVTGEGKEGILIVAESPGVHEDEQGKQLVGESGKYLRKILRFLDYDLDKDFWKTNAVRCCVPKKKDPTDAQIKNCYEELKTTIQKLKPKAIIAFGSIAVKALGRGRLSTSSIQALAGNKIPLPEFDCWLFPQFHPAFILRNEFDKNLSCEFERNIRWALRTCRNLPKLPNINPHPHIHQLDDPDKIGELVDRIMEEKLESAFDYETSGFNPYVAGHKTHTVAITLPDLQTYAFAIDHPDSGYDKHDHIYVSDCVRDYVSCSAPKIAQNSQFERQWSKWVLKAPPNNFNWCTMTTEHLIDNRTGITGLKHQAFVHYGIEEYDKGIKPFIKSVPGTPFNRMHEAPLPMVLLYNGIDSFVTMLRYQDQLKQIDSLPVQRFFNLGLKTFSDLTANGIHVDEEYYERGQKELDEEIVSIYEEIHKSKEAKTYTQKYGELTLTSSDNVKDLLYDVCGLKTDKKTKSGGVSTDKDTLGKFDHWIPKKILRARKLVKAKDYLQQYQRVAVDGVMHPSFTLHIPRSFRSSSSNPNAHNAPKRDKEVKEKIRGGWVPSKGNKLAEVDFSGIEVTTSALYHKDPTFIHYLMNADADMHRDNAADLWCLKPSEVTDEIRFYAKNGWTFPQFYGDYYGSCALSLWENRDLEIEEGYSLVEHLRSVGIDSFSDFENHCKKIEQKMWFERFPVYTQWKKDICTFYQKHGFIETYLGFKFRGYMDKKQACNYPIQSTAFHVLLWCLIKLNSQSIKDRWSSKFIGQIHDSMIMDLNPKEEQMVFNAFKHTCEEDVVNRFEWIDIPFKIDIEVSDKDGNFAKMNKVKF